MLSNNSALLYRTSDARTSVWPRPQILDCFCSFSSARYSWHFHPCSHRSNKFQTLYIIMVSPLVMCKEIWPLWMWWDLSQNLSCLIAVWCLCWLEIVPITRVSICLLRFSDGWDYSDGNVTCQKFNDDSTWSPQADASIILARSFLLIYEQIYPFWLR